MKIITNSFKPWSGAISTYETILEADKLEEFESLILVLIQSLQR